MIGLFKSMSVTFKTMLRKPVTVQYPDKHLPMSSRYKGFPVLLWDDKVGEPACTGCGVCMRYCPTECMTTAMKENPLAKEGKSTRKKIIDTFEIKWERCILCGICVEVCNFDAIVMSDFHEEADGSRGGLVADLPKLLEKGRDYQKRAGITVGQSATEEEQKS